MFAQMTNALDFQGKALVLRAERQRLIASNIANADTPSYVAHDLDFRRAMAEATGGETATNAPARQVALSAATTDARHIATASSASAAGSGDPANRGLAYVVRSQPSMDGNTVDLDQERSNFVDNAVRYESTLRFINGHAKTILSAITGQ